MSFETAFKKIDDSLRKESGCATELDYIEQTSWLLFLKYINDYEIDLEKKAKLSVSEYTPILEKEFSWYGWAKVVGFVNLEYIKGMLLNDQIKLK